MRRLLRRWQCAAEGHHRTADRRRAVRTYGAEELKVADPKPAAAACARRRQVGAGVGVVAVVRRLALHTAAPDRLGDLVDSQEELEVPRLVPSLAVVGRHIAVDVKLLSVPAARRRRSRHRKQRQAEPPLDRNAHGPCVHAHVLVLGHSVEPIAGMRLRGADEATGVGGES